MELDKTNISQQGLLAGDGTFRRSVDQHMIFLWC